MGASLRCLWHVLPSMLLFLYYNAPLCLFWRGHARAQRRRGDAVAASLLSVKDERVRGRTVAMVKSTRAPPPAALR